MEVPKIVPYRTASLLRPPPPIFGRNYCIGLFYLHYTPPRWPLEPVYGTAVLARVRVLQE